MNAPDAVYAFFYGLFMDEALLRDKGLNPVGGELASVEGFTLRIGQRAALVPAPDARVHGLVFSLTRPELDRLYSEPSVRAYEPQIVRVRLARGAVVSALCYNLPEPPSADERNPEYAAKLRALAARVGLPSDYIESIR
jgi:Gamma-glutamyl cyclotransferase, AIG2-like